MITLNIKMADRRAEYAEITKGVSDKKLLKAYITRRARESFKDGMRTGLHLSNALHSLYQCGKRDGWIIKFNGDMGEGRAEKIVEKNPKLKEFAALMLTNNDQLHAAIEKQKTAGTNHPICALCLDVFDEERNRVLKSADCTCYETLYHEDCAVVLAAGCVKKETFLFSCVTCRTPCYSLDEIRAIERFRDKKRSITRQETDDARTVTCDICEAEMIIKKTKQGEFYACPNWQPEKKGCQGRTKPIIAGL